MGWISLDHGKKIYIQELNEMINENDYTGRALCPEGVMKPLCFANWVCPQIGMDLIVKIEFTAVLWTQRKNVFLFQNMPSIPSPTIMQLDPNDENIILSIPEDTGPVVKENASTLTPKKVQHEEFFLHLFG